MPRPEYCGVRCEPRQRSKDEKRKAEDKVRGSKCSFKAVRKR